MTLFDAASQPLPRSSRPLERQAQRPAWSKYTVKKPVRCYECSEVALETLQAGKGLPFALRDARFSRRQAGVTRLYCAEHANAQRDEDRQAYNLKESA